MAWPPSVLTRLILLVVLAAIGAWETRLSLVAGFLTLVAVVSSAVRTSSREERWRSWALIGVAAVLSSVGFIRFVVTEAIPGVIAGGRAAAEKHAVAYLRTIVAAQDYMRRSAHQDPDGDHVGSAASLAELGGKRPLPSGSLEQNPLYLTDDQWLPSTGFVAAGAYVYRVCLPEAGGGWFDPGTEAPSPRIDSERAEREYLVYGWPKTWSPGSPTTVYVSDAYEAIRILDETIGSNGARYAGESAPPPCDLATRDARFVPWNKKAPRTHLPGDSR